MSIKNKLKGLFLSAAMAVAFTVSAQIQKGEDVMFNGDWACSDLTAAMDVWKTIEKEGPGNLVGAEMLKLYNKIPNGSFPMCAPIQGLGVIEAVIDSQRWKEVEIAIVEVKLLDISDDSYSTWYTWAMIKSTKKGM